MSQLSSLQEHRKVQSFILHAVLFVRIIINSESVVLLLNEDTNLLITFGRLLNFGYHVISHTHVHKNVLEGLKD